MIVVEALPEREPHPLQGRTYQLTRLASGSYDVSRDGAIIAGLVRNGPSDRATWTAELLEDLPTEERPAPFTETEHEFRSFEEARAWLGRPSIRPAPPAAEGS